MLDIGDRGQELKTWICSLPCSINVPAKLREDFERSGTAATVFDEVRCGVRVNCRSDKNRAALEMRQSLPAFPHNAEWQAVYVTNVSQKGCGFLFGQVLYPGERFNLMFFTGLQQTIEVAWCRRIDKNCFEVGSRFAEASPASTAKE